MGTTMGMTEGKDGVDGAQLKSRGGGEMGKILGGRDRAVATTSRDQSGDPEARGEAGATEAGSYTLS